MTGEWTCFICNRRGTDGTKGFYLHYMREHR